MDEFLKDAISDLCKILQINSVESQEKPNMPFGKGNAECLSFALKLMSESGLSVKNLDNYAGYGQIGEGTLFGILAHLDVVPEGEGWTYPPFGAEIHDNTIFGRGALDNKGPFIACLYALKKLLAQGLIPKKRVRIILGCDEESGWKCMEHYKKTEEIPAEGFSPDGDFPVINCEKGVVYHNIRLKLPKTVYSITAGTRPNVVPSSAVAKLKYTKKMHQAAISEGITATHDGQILTLTSTGVAAHASHPEDGSNALIKLLGALRHGYKVFSRLYDLFSHMNGKDTPLGLCDDISGLLTMNLGVARTENNHLSLVLDIRYPISYKKEQLSAIIKESLKGISVERGDFHDPLYVPKDNPLVESLLKAYNEVTGQNATPLTVGGATYARFLPVGVAFGPIFPTQKSTIHQPNECISFEHLGKLIDIYYRAIKNLCF